MDLKDFLVEQWMNDHEGRAVFNMTDTCVSPLSFRELSALDTEHLLDSVILDYGEIKGDSRLRKEILSLYKSGTEDNITLMHGCLQANEAVMYALLDRGSRVITFTPGYQQFTEIPQSIGCETVTVRLLEENGWMPDEEALQKAFETHADMLVINNPNNPTGTLFDEGYLEKLIALCQRHGTYILSDEVYQGLSEREVSVSDLYEKGISTSSLSKVYSLAGLRLGWIKADESVIRKISVRRDYSIISTGPLADSLALTALRNKEKLLERSAQIVSENRRVLGEWLAAEKKASVVMPGAGTTAFLKYDAAVSSERLALGLLEKEGVFFVPGSCFGTDKHLRLGLTRDTETMRKGLSILSEYLRRYS
ncbi:MAG: aminotransferase class I/II-fold pyridoxal phosphate-dependent enzyme [Solobacterium sp.]|nr:aminotransferase class I/II-fold pyridoxal phosphate-dependent enzyme [Solobacterium sp.]